uniref:Uncharacterized protein n=1 Tax=Solanum tuberosum TaxID=4113 RepID=M1DEE9_SOLTU
MNRAARPWFGTESSNEGLREESKSRLMRPFPRSVSRPTDRTVRPWFETEGGLFGVHLEDSKCGFTTPIHGATNESHRRIVCQTTDHRWGPVVQPSDLGKTQDQKVTPTTVNHSLLVDLRTVQVLSIQITLRSILDLISAASMVSPHTSRTIDTLSILVVAFSFSFVRVSWGLVGLVPIKITIDLVSA